MIKPFLVILSVLALAACGTTEKETGEKEKISTDNNKEVVEEEVLFPYDTLLTDMSKFIAGIRVEKFFDDLQSQTYYNEHRKFTDTSWAKTKKNMLEPIGKWCIDKKTTDASDSVLCFYPLSGPDFLFGNTFFPHSNNYVLLGLEPNGSMCDFKELNEAQITRYLSGVRESMAYLNKAGYFVTSHMSGDFNRAQLNGMVHMMLYMMARTNHTIVAVNKISVDSAGNVSVTTEKKLEEPNLAGVRIDFLSPDRKTKKSAYYFRLNVRDKEIKQITGFVPFINAFGKRVSYMKSASCVLTNTDFSVMRNLVLGSEKVVQDDTGVPYHYFSSDTFDISLYGEYTMTIKDLNWCMQNDLKKAILKSPDNKPLPFRISYNGNYNEGMLLFAKRKK
ncbi:MAG: hypothetical protein ACHQF2_05275 [Flavobacteriales bacterium]